MARPLIAITLGDPAGIGPEVVLKALANPATAQVCRPVVVGDARFVERDLALAGARLQVRRIQDASAASGEPGLADVLDLPVETGDGIRFGAVSATAGRAAATAVIRAAELARVGEVHAIVTAPLNKESLHRAGYRYPGHTEFLAHLTGAERVWMLLLGGGLRVIHVSTHVSLREAIARVTVDRVIETIRAGHRALGDLGLERPCLAVAGLNPHAGEGGLFGGEDVEQIGPAVEQARREGIDARGPEPPDTVFLRAIRGEFDGVVAMYHDQGHIPSKLLGFDEGVNVSVGLPIVRTSVDHGTAFDIAGKGIAREASMIAAIRAAAAIAGRRDR